MSRLYLYDTTLRDGTQGAGISFTSEEKLAVCHRLDEFGIDYIEGGWPGSNPRDAHFFALARKASFRHAKLAAFSATRRPGIDVRKDPNINALLESETPVAAIFGKSWDLHVERMLATTLEENLAMIHDSVAWLKSQGREVVYDAEQFFDGYKHNPAYALETLCAAREAGADFLVLCDTNGGSLPSEVTRVLSEVQEALSARFGEASSCRLGIHTHNDCGLAVANSIAAVEAGAVMVQGTINGIGERTGNADLTSVIPILQLKMGLECVPRESLADLTRLARYISELAHMIPLNSRPFVGKNAFAHKAGVHVSAVMKAPESYEHMEPALVGNQRRVLVSDLSGRSNIEFKAQELGMELGGRGTDSGMDSKAMALEIKRLEQDGYQFDQAEGSFQLLVERLTERFVPRFVLDSLRITIEKDRDQAGLVQVLLKLRIGEAMELAAAEGRETVHVLDQALHKILDGHFPALRDMKTKDFNIRVIDGHEGAPSRSRVSIEATDGEHRWSTMGVSENVIEACWVALADSFHYKLGRAGP